MTTSDPGGDCTFCTHAQALHTGNEIGSTGCAAPECGDEQARRGRCAVYTSPARKAASDRWFAAYAAPLTVTPSEVAARLHRAHSAGEHSLYLSCACAHQAMALLGLE